MRLPTVVRLARDRLNPPSSYGRRVMQAETDCFFTLAAGRRVISTALRLQETSSRCRVDQCLRPVQLVTSSRSLMRKDEIRRIMLTGTSAEISLTENAAQDSQVMFAPSGRRIEWYSDPFLLSQRIKVLVAGTSKDVEDAMDLVDRHTGAANGPVYSALIHGLVARQKAVRALDYYHQMIARKVEPTPSTYCSVLQALFQLVKETDQSDESTLSSLFQRAVVLLESIPSDKINIYHVNTMLNICRRCSNVGGQEFGWKTYMTTAHNLPPKRRNANMLPQLSETARDAADEFLVEEETMSNAVTGWDRLTPDTRTITLALRLCSTSTVYEWFERGAEIWQDHFPRSSAVLDQHLLYTLIRHFLYSPSPAFIRTVKKIYSPAIRVYDPAFKGFDLACAAFGISLEKVKNKREVTTHPVFPQLASMHKKISDNLAISPYQMDQSILDLCLRLCTRLWCPELGALFLNVAKTSGVPVESNIADSILTGLIRAHRFKEALDVTQKLGPHSISLDDAKTINKPLVTHPKRLSELDHYSEPPPPTLSMRWRHYRLALRVRVLSNAVQYMISHPPRRVRYTVVGESEPESRAFWLILTKRTYLEMIQLSQEARALHSSGRPIPRRADDPPRRVVFFDDPFRDSILLKQMLLALDGDPVDCVTVARVVVSFKEAVVNLTEKVGSMEEDLETAMRRGSEATSNNVERDEPDDEVDGILLTEESPLVNIPRSRRLLTSHLDCLTKCARVLDDAVTFYRTGQIVRPPKRLSKSEMQHRVVLEQALYKAASEMPNDLKRKVSEEEVAEWRNLRSQLKPFLRAREVKAAEENKGVPKVTKKMYTGGRGKTNKAGPKKSGYKNTRFTS
ncbi:hypothetical protein DFJ73DRAFT_810989 [Zopfochytrium polystomum]|nr:hypothetical protein DFJ73DRAFT_810989 [Zopfochytrium polystomum]